MPGLDGLFDFLHRNGLYVAGVAFASFLYLLVDFFIVIKDFLPVLRARSFWLLWFCTFILNILAFTALQASQTNNGSFGSAQPLALIVMSTLGTAVILQSFTFKIGDRKVVDVSKIMEDFRATVLEDVSRHAASAGRKFMLRTAESLFHAFQDNPEDLRTQFINVMSFGGRNAAQVQADLARLEADVQALRVPAAMLLAQRIAQADVQEAQRLVWSARTRP